MLNGPFPERSNRVIRWFPNHHRHFLRVSFVEEGGAKFRFEQSEIDGSHFIRTRVGGVMTDGLKFGGRLFEFLGEIIPYRGWRPFLNLPLISMVSIRAQGTYSLLCSSVYT